MLYNNRQASWMVIADVTVIQLVVLLFHSPLVGSRVFLDISVENIIPTCIPISFSTDHHQYHN